MPKKSYRFVIGLSEKLDHGFSKRDKLPWVAKLGEPKTNLAEKVIHMTKYWTTKDSQGTSKQFLEFTVVVPEVATYLFAHSQPYSLTAYKRLLGSDL